MSSLILRTLNAYPEWKTMKTTTEVAKFIVSKNNENPEYPTNINTTRQKKRYFEKFGTDFIVEKGKKGKLKAAVKWGVGVDNVDFEACKELNIPTFSIFFQKTQT